MKICFATFSLIAAALFAGCGLMGYSQPKSHPRDADLIESFNKNKADYLKLAQDYGKALNSTDRGSKEYQDTLDEIRQLEKKLRASMPELEKGVQIGYPVCITVSKYSMDYPWPRRWFLPSDKETFESSKAFCWRLEDMTDHFGTQPELRDDLDTFEIESFKRVTSSNKRASAASYRKIDQDWSIYYRGEDTFYETPEE